MSETKEWPCDHIDNNFFTDMEFRSIRITQPWKVCPICGAVRPGTKTVKTKKYGLSAARDTYGDWWLEFRFHSILPENLRSKERIWPVKFDADGFVELPE